VGPPEPNSPAAARGHSAARHAPVGLLVAMFKEFHAIDSLVIRDYYHRYHR